MGNTMKKTDTQRIKIKYLQEDTFKEQMEQTAEPYLKKYRRCGRLASFDGTQLFYVCAAAGKGQYCHFAWIQ